MFASSLTLLVLKISSYVHRKVLRLYRNIKEKMVWNHFIRLFLEEYIFIGVVCLIKVTVISFTNVYQIMLSTYALSMVLLAVLFPLFTFHLLRQTHKKGEIKNIWFKQRFGALTLDLKLRHKETLYFTTFF